MNRLQPLIRAARDIIRAWNADKTAPLQSCDAARLRDAVRFAEREPCRDGYAYGLVEVSRDVAQRLYTLENEVILYAKPEDPGFHPVESFLQHGWDRLTVGQFYRVEQFGASAARPAASDPPPAPLPAEPCSEVVEDCLATNTTLDVVAVNAPDDIKASLRFVLERPEFNGTGRVFCHCDLAANEWVLAFQWPNGAKMTSIGPSLRAAVIMAADRVRANAHMKQVSTLPRTPRQIRLRELVDQLRGISPDLVVRGPNGRNISGFGVNKHSYPDLSFTYTVRAGMRVRDLIDALVSACGRRYGHPDVGTFVPSDRTLLWLDGYFGSSSDAMAVTCVEAVAGVAVIQGEARGLGRV